MAAPVVMECGDFLEFQVIITLSVVNLVSYTVYSHELYFQ
jgi:hypothetical protein